ncbi:hypothetical protein DIURU_001064 [Diutina rugosa]|uniref:25S rRNA (Uridine(2843)-N(3))-methyltransferase n=1 Tax=Diutina rugosa TaxID=5481 RepID=A0A642V0A8_DIURU|nr:uncharacterized protein DIURU_001064 [Diutina rugosa]KAA8906326.1 hypothetical protein DIURU_001064 [Diutina rugosa]
MSNRRAQKYRERQELRQQIEEEEEAEVPSVTSSNEHLPFASEECIEPEKVIEMFKTCLADILESEDLQDVIQEVKGDLYRRDYLVAFDDDEKRYAYASRWTPSRAIAYASLFGSLEQITELFKSNDGQRKALCVGGGAAGELVGLGAVYARQKQLNPQCPALSVDLVDIANWKNVVASLYNNMSSWFYDPSQFTTKFMKNDILSSSISFSDYDLITVLFTTNELFTEKRKETIGFLSRLSAQCKPGSLLLMAESAGSYSHIEVGSKKFPVQMLIDMVLLGKKGEDNGAWEVVDQSESCWYRVRGELNYPMKLENMRFFYRLYKHK